jgi:hypothetical protein
MHRSLQGQLPIKITCLFLPLESEEEIALPEDRLDLVLEKVKKYGRAYVHIFRYEKEREDA